jgi:outer membrane protein assembly factor BamB
MIWALGFEGVQSTRGSPTPATVGTDQTLYFGVGPYMVAVNSSSYILWVFETPTNKSVEASPALGSDGTAFFGCNDSYVYAVDYTGSLVWAYESIGAVTSTPALGSNGEGSVVFVGSSGGYLHALHQGNGSLMWQYAAGSAIQSSPVWDADNDMVYLTTSAGWVVAVSTLDGSLSWKYSMPSSISSSPAVGWGSLLYVTLESGDVYALTTSTGAMVWRDHIGSPISSSPVVDMGGSIYFGTDKGVFYCIESPGNVLWEYNTSDAATWHSAAIGYGGVIYAGNTDGLIVAFTGAALQVRTSEPTAAPTYAVVRLEVIIDLYNITAADIDIDSFFKETYISTVADVVDVNSSLVLFGDYYNVSSSTTSATRRELLESSTDIVRTTFTILLYNLTECTRSLKTLEANVTSGWFVKTLASIGIELHSAAAESVTLAVMVNGECLLTTAAPTPYRKKAHPTAVPTPSSKKAAYPTAAPSPDGKKVGYPTFAPTPTPSAEPTPKPTTGHEVVCVATSLPLSNVSYSSVITPAAKSVITTSVGQTTNTSTSDIEVNKYSNLCDDKSSTKRKLWATEMLEAHDISNGGMAALGASVSTTTTSSSNISFSITRILSGT